MKKYILSLLPLLMLVCQSLMVNCQDFKAEQLTSVSTIILKGGIDRVFPLFGAFEEKKWADPWSPTPVFPASGKMEDGLIFKTPGHIHGESNVTWVVLKFDLVNHQVSYLEIGTNRLIRIDIQCTELEENATEASVTYQITGLNSEGNEIAHKMVRKLSASGLKDWATAINEYLTKNSK